MTSLDRRRFLTAAAATTALAIARKGWAFAPANPVLTIHADKAVAHVPADFTGLSYETSQLIHPSFFSAENKALIAYFKTLGDSGVLRLGGNMSEFTVWSPTDPAEGTADEEGVEGPDPGKGSARTFTITPRAIRNLNAFLEATNWKLIYGLNLARGTAELAAEEAACVAKFCGSRLLAFQFGNEPDLFKHNGDVKDRWQYPEYMAKWKTFRDAVLAKVPKAPLAGPDTSFKPSWLTPFAEDTKGSTFLMTAHYYAEGPPTNPDMTIHRLLTNDAKFDSNVMSAVELARKANLPYRMSEGNTCYNAGKKGVSDTFASALWAGDFLAKIATIGGTGVNLHGGGNGLYTPIAGSTKEGFTARPDYYGMMMTKPLFGSTMLLSELNTGGLTLTAYAAQKKGVITVLAFNKGDQATTLEIKLPAGRVKGSGSVLRLTAAGIEATEGVTFGGSQVAVDGTWKPTSSEPVKISGGSVSISLPAYSAASVSFS